MSSKQKSAAPTAAPKRRRIHVPAPALLELPEHGLLRIGDFIPRFISVGRSTWWVMVAEGRAPAGRKLSPRVHVWTAEEIRGFIAGRG